MIQKLIPYIIGGQFCIGLFHAGFGIEQWLDSGIFDTQTLFIFFLALGTLLVYRRLLGIPISDRGFSIIFQHAILIGIITWFFYQSWGNSWELFLVVFLSLNTALSLIFITIESQIHISIGGGNWGIPDNFWKLGTLLTLINTITIPLIFIILHQSLSIIWIFFGINWLFLWKEE
ncbi:hypothetical protein KBB89_02490 [Candidatus Gracilibacteria bacterium]|nr:hypothetical protein [Candidatus Gracilibacteria bacterium]